MKWIKLQALKLALPCQSKTGSVRRGGVAVETRKVGMTRAAVVFLPAFPTSRVTNLSGRALTSA